MTAQLTVPAGRPSEAFFSNIPQEAAETLRSGFSQLADLTPDQLEALLAYVVSWLDPSELAPEVDELANQCKVAPSDMTAIAAAATVQASALFTAKPPMPPKVFIEEAINAGVLSPDHASTIENFGTEHLEARQDTFRAAFARGRCSTEIVPCFASLSATIELRVADLDEKHFVTVPTALALLTTDVTDERLVFQMTRRDVRELMKRLESLDEQLALAKNTRTEVR